MCFPSGATAPGRGRGAVRMDALRVGDAVLTVGHSGALEWQEVYFFGKRHPDTVGQYHRLVAVTALGAAVELRASGTHFVPVSLDAGGWCNASSAAQPAVEPAWRSHFMVLARDVRPGMLLWHASGAAAVGSAPTPACVTATHSMLDAGAFIPHVRARALVVDSVAAAPHSRSTYMALYRLPFSAHVAPGLMAEPRALPSADRQLQRWKVSRGGRPVALGALEF